MSERATEDAEAILAEAKQCFAANETRAAAEKFREALQLAPDNFGILEGYAYAAGLHDPGAAVEACMAFADRHTDNPKQVTSALGIALPFLETQRRRSHGLSSYTAEQIGEPPFRFSMDVVARWRTNAERWIAGSPHNVTAGCAMAQSSFALGRYDECDRWLDAIRPHHPNKMLTVARLSGAFFDAIDHAAAQFRPRLAPMITLQPGAGARRVFVGCDQGYFEKFGPVLARSFAATGTDAVLHYHVFDPVGTLAQDVLRDATHGRFGLTVEATGFAGTPKARLYYAAVRLLRLFELMDAAPVPTLFLDADLGLQTSLDDLFGRLEQADVALCPMPGRVTLHSQINASVVGINATPAGMGYLREVAGFIANCLAAGIAPWCLDQTALLCALVRSNGLRQASAPFTALAVGPRIYDGTLDAAAWPQKVPADSPSHAAWQALLARYAA